MAWTEALTRIATTPIACGDRVALRMVFLYFTVMKRVILAGAAAAFLALAGCAIYASAPDIRRFTQLQPGVSTLADAERLMGKPQATAQPPGRGASVVWADDGRVVTLYFDAGGRYLGPGGKAGF